MFRQLEIKNKSNKAINKVFEQYSCYLSLSIFQNLIRSLRKVYALV